MKFEVHHLIAASLEEIETSFVDERYAPFLLQHLPALQQLQLLEVRRLPGRLIRRVRYAPSPVIHAIGPKKMDPAWFSFVAYSTYNFDTKVLSFCNEPDNAKVRAVLLNQGEFHFSPQGNHTRRRALGHIELCLPERLRFLGAPGEYLIRREGLKMLSGEIPVLERFAQEVLRARTDTR